MRGAYHPARSFGGGAALFVVALALAMRLVVPTGWMPATSQGFAITLCTGMGAAPAWIDASGQLHKGKQAPDQAPDHPCVFAGFGAALDMPSLPAPPILPVVLGAVLLPGGALGVAIGRGLAAPPPPPTGPPARA